MLRLSSKGTAFADFWSMILFMVVGGFLIVSLYVANLSNASQAKSAAYQESNTVLASLSVRESMDMPIAYCEGITAAWPLELDASSWTIGDALGYILENTAIISFPVGSGPVKDPPEGMAHYIEAAEALFEVRSPSVIPQSRAPYQSSYAGIDFAKCARCAFMRKTVGECILTIFRSRQIDASLALENGKGKMVPMLMNKRAYEAAAGAASLARIPLLGENQGLLVSAVKMPRGSELIAAGEGYII